jgi:hypothetical protein
MHPDTTFYFVAIAQTLTTSLSDRRLREMIATRCPGADVDTMAREFHAVREILEREAMDEHAERLNTYINIIPQYDDPAKIKLLKDML